MSPRDFVAYETTKLAMMKVMEALKDKDIQLIWIHGMGGVGKTTLVKEMGKKAEEEKLFKKVVMAIISQHVDLKKIQGEIAGMLGLQFRSQTDIGRANELHNRLEDATLIILDDVWARLNVADIGIPFPFDKAHKNSKIVITTRREQICHAMSTGIESTKIVRLDVLCENDSWDLFRRNAGDAVDSRTLNSVVKSVVKHCQGLPLAIVTVGRAMKGKYKPEEWIEAAQELKASTPTSIEGVDEEVHKSLKLSYDYLEDEETKSCFLLCCLFPEDHDILVEDLVRYGIGLRIFKNVYTLQEARQKVNIAIKNLQDSCLLLTSDIPGCTKMHDIIRDVAISIAFNKYFVRAGGNLEDWPNMETLEHYNGISLMCNKICHELPDCRELPNLQILLVQDNWGLRWSYSYSFFSRLKALTVLDLSRSRVEVLEDLKSLEVISFKISMFERPIDTIKKLTNLRLLDLTESNLDYIIPANVISQLSRLEELYLLNSNIKYKLSAPVEVAGLESLSRLKVLFISLDATLISSKDFTFPDLETFVIHICGRGRWWSRSCDANHITLVDPVGATILWQKRVKRLFKRTNSLYLESLAEVKNILPDLSFGGDGLNALKELWLGRSVAFQYLINTEEEEWRIPSHEKQYHQQVLSNLEQLSLYELGSFEGIFHGALPFISSGFLSKLESLDVRKCSKLSNVLLPFNLLQRLQGLRTLGVTDCESLEQVFDFETQGLVDEVQLLSSLRDLGLKNLPRLKHLFNCHGRIVQLHNLVVMRIMECHSLKSLFRHSVAPSLQKLKVLTVYNCVELEEIVANKDGGHKEEEETVDKIVFQSFKTLKLIRLLNLNGFCTGNVPFYWPSLQNVTVHSCPKMMTFAAIGTTSGIQSMPKLKSIKLDGVKKMLEGEDLNTVIKNHFKAKGTSLSL
ncbi:hypothetical protein F0562_032749 [Nyssa sinensis]|uniref:Uncharacterized protein n=1 Tax=Nyssa sinensis TaxID=561372 RepID=A0A5J5AS82_9ASTE|nr:hypothetical protein F0562_032749 [Nyssa sinensis]